MTKHTLMLHTIFLHASFFFPFDSKWVFYSYIDYISRVGHYECLNVAGSYSRGEFLKKNNIFLHLNVYFPLPAWLILFHFVSLSYFFNFNFNFMRVRLQHRLKQLYITDLCFILFFFFKKIINKSINII